MEFRNLLSFLKVAECGSFTRAAERLGYAQSTISMQIKALEEELGLPLFETIGKRTRLTPYGSDILDHARQILQNVEQMKAISGALPEGGAVSLRIGATSSLFAAFLIRVVSDFKKQYPNVVPQIITARSTDLIDALKKNDLDLIFTLGERWRSENLSLAASVTSRVVFFCAKENVLARQAKARYSLDEILSQPLLLPCDKDFVFAEFCNLMEIKRKPYQVAMQTNDFLAILEMARNDWGVGIQTEAVLRAVIEGGRDDYFILPTEEFLLPIRISAFHHKAKWLSPHMSDFLRRSAEVLEGGWTGR